MMQLIVADVGNSSIKYFVHEHWTSDVSDFSLVQSRSVDVAGDLSEFAVDEPLHWLVSSVNSSHLAKLKRTADQRGWVSSWHQVGREHIELKIDLESPEAVGIDRLLAAMAATTNYVTEGHVIVIDCGTALTIDLVERDGVFRGGVIIAGPRASLKALSLLTSALPDLSKSSIKRPSSVVGESTENAMLSGAYYYGLGAIKAVVSEINGQLDAPPKVVGTGGGLGLWRDVLPDDWILVDNLVLEGILLSAPKIFTAAK